VYTYQEAHVEEYLKAADEAFKAIRVAIDSGEPEKHLLGKPVASGFKRLN